MQDGVSSAGCAVLRPITAPLEDTGSYQLTWPLGPARAAKQGSPVNQRSTVARLRTSDQQAVEELFNACYPRLAGWVRRLVDDDETAHEIASEAFTRLLSRWSGLDNPQSYLYMIATNLVRDHWRKTGRERNAFRVMTAAGSADPAYHPAQDVDVRALIQALPERLRSPFLLHYYGGFGLKEVAVMLGRPEGTIKADLFNARARLKAALGDPSD
jgi:RNA polymerase sigma-70 factor (ECF subfamily)